MPTQTTLFSALVKTHYWTAYRDYTEPGKTHGWQLPRKEIIILFHHSVFLLCRTYKQSKRVQEFHWNGPWHFLWLCAISKFEHPRHFSFQILNPPTKGKYLYRSFIEIMSIWKQMDRQQEGEIHAKLIGATHPISHLQNAVCYILQDAVSWPVQRGRHVQCVPRASKHLSILWR